MKSHVRIVATITSQRKHVKGKVAVMGLPRTLRTRGIILGASTRDLHPHHRRPSHRPPLLHIHRPLLHLLHLLPENSVVWMNRHVTIAAILTSQRKSVKGKVAAMGLPRTLRTQNIILGVSTRELHLHHRRPSHRPPLLHIHRLHHLHHTHHHLHHLHLLPLENSR
jgi:hypothetical protein